MKEIVQNVKLLWGHLLYINEETIMNCHDYCCYVVFLVVSLSFRSDMLMFTLLFQQTRKRVT